MTVLLGLVRAFPSLTPPSSDPRSGALHVGDRLLSINGVTLEHAAVEEAMQLLSQSGIMVRLEIAPHHLFTVRPGFNQEGEGEAAVGEGGMSCVRVC